jgi:hypothetical protein
MEIFALATVLEVKIYGNMELKFRVFFGFYVKAKQLNNKACKVFKFKMGSRPT